MDTRPWGLGGMQLCLLWISKTLAGPAGTWLPTPGNCGNSRHHSSCRAGWPSAGQSPQPVPPARCAHRPSSSGAGWVPIQGLAGSPTPTVTAPSPGDWLRMQNRARRRGRGIAQQRPCFQGHQWKAQRWFPLLAEQSHGAQGHGPPGTALPDWAQASCCPTGQRI